LRNFDTVIHIDRSPPHSRVALGKPAFALVAAGLCLLALLWSGEASAGDQTGQTDSAFGGGADAAPAHEEAGGKGIRPEQQPEAGGEPPLLNQRVALEGQEVSDGQPLLSLSWGTGEGQVGLQLPGEGLARGPEAFAVTGDGRIALLDSVNRRLLLFDQDQRLLCSVDLTLPEPAFVDADEQTIAVLDRRGEQLLEFDWRGSLRQELELPPPADVVTGLFVESGLVGLEIAHDTVLNVIPARPNPAGRSRAATDASPGRPLRARLAGTVTAEFKRGSAPRVNFSAGKGGERSRRVDVDFGRPLEHLVALSAAEDEVLIAAKLPESAQDSGGASRIAVARIPMTESTAPMPDPFVSLGESLLLEVPDFAYVGEPCVFGKDGLVYQPLAGPEGYSIVVHRTERQTAKGASI